jgi:ubiquinone/menaquinone biosynthesis C-methylase UbiE
MPAEQYWDGVAQRYVDLYKSEWFKDEDKITRAIVRREFAQSNGDRVLDIGCGTGLCYDFLASSGRRLSYCGIDISANMLTIFRLSHPAIDVRHGAAENILPRLPASSFDLIVSTNTAASFLLDTRGLLGHVSRILQPDGRYSLSFLNRQSLRRLTRLKRGPIEFYRTRGDRVGGKRIECKDIVEMIAVCDQIKEAAQTFKAVLEAAAQFGGEEVLAL